MGIGSLRLMPMPKISKTQIYSLAVFVLERSMKRELCNDPQPKAKFVYLLTEIYILMPKF